MLVVPQTHSALLRKLFYPVKRSIELHGQWSCPCQKLRPWCSIAQQLEPM